MWTFFSRWLSSFKGTFLLPPPFWKKKDCFELHRTSPPSNEKKNEKKKSYSWKRVATGGIPSPLPSLAKAPPPPSPSLLNNGHSPLRRPWFRLPNKYSIPQICFALLQNPWTSRRVSGDQGSAVTEAREESKITNDELMERTAPHNEEDSTAPVQRTSPSQNQSRIRKRSPSFGEDGNDDENARQRMRKERQNGQMEAAAAKRRASDSS